MYERALLGGRRYWALLILLAGGAGLGVLAYLYQLVEGLTVTDMSRDVPWGLYIAQLTFLVGVAASAVMVVIPYYLHDYKAFGKVTVLGEFLAISAVAMCGLFIFVDIGQPMRGMNMPLNPSPRSVLFWDMIALGGYLFLNLLIARVTFGAEKKGVPPPWWVKPFIYLSIPWAVSIHTVTAFLYCGLSARPFWMTAILAPRFLASAFSGGPALLILLCLVVRNVSKFDVGDRAISALSKIVAWAMVVNVFFVLAELFTAFYSDIPHHLHHFEYLYVGLVEDGVRKMTLVPWMWTSALLSLAALFALLVPQIRNHTIGRVVACLLVISAIWIEKGLGLVVTGFIPNPMGRVTEYWPSPVELVIGLGIYCIGGLILAVLFKIAVSVREDELQA